MPLHHCLANLRWVNEVWGTGDFRAKYVILVELIIMLRVWLQRVFDRWLVMGALLYFGRISGLENPDWKKDFQDRFLSLYSMKHLYQNVGCGMAVLGIGICFGAESFFNGSCNNYTSCNRCWKAWDWWWINLIMLGGASIVQGIFLSNLFWTEYMNNEVWILNISLIWSMCGWV